MIWSLLNFTGRWIPIQSWNFQNCRRCHGNCEIVDLTYIGNCQRDFHKTWHIYLVGLVEYSDPKKISSEFHYFQKAADKIGTISMFSDFNENWYLGLFWSEELVGNDENCIQDHSYDATVSKMAANKIGILLMVSDFNENWYLEVFWSKELVCNAEICIQGHFNEATIFKMAVNKIVNLAMVPDFNVNWYLGVSWSEELVGNDETCIHMPEFWYGVVWGLLCLHPNTIKPRYVLRS